MIDFKGFPPRMRFTPVPNIVFSSLLPQITDVDELKILLHIFEILYPKKGNLKFVSSRELLECSSLISGTQESAEKRLNRSLEALEKKGVLLHLVIEKGGAREDIYFLNTAANQMLIKKIQVGEIVLPDIKAAVPVAAVSQEPADIFTLYEQNIGMLTPLIADEIKEAGRQYPEIWIKDAIREAVAANKRNWKYILRILERWAVEGKYDGTYRGHLKKNTDPDKYIRGKYGHMVQR